MKSLKYLFIFAILLSFEASQAGWTNHSKGLFHIQSAYTQEKGSLRLGSHSSSYFKDVTSTGPDGTPRGVTYFDVQGGLGLTYGLTNHFELGFSQLVYQDNHKGGNGYNLPDDLFLKAKLGSIGSRTGNFRIGLQLNSRIPTAEHHNVPFEPYSAGRIELGFMGLVTFASDPIFPDYGVNLHFNAGFLNHNDVGTKLSNSATDTVTAEKSSTELLYGFGISRAWQEFSLFLEVYGSNFIQQPPASAYTRENSFYVTPGLSYAPYSWLSLSLGLDLRVSGNDDETDYDLVHKIEDLPNLPSWKIFVGASISLIAPKTPRPIEYQPVQASQTTKTTDDKELFQALADERRKTEDAEQELERIRTERQRMEQMLERLRRLLDWPSQTAQSKEKQSESPSPDPE